MKIKNLLRLVCLAAFFSHADFAIAQTWIQTSPPTNHNWTSVAISADGTKLVATGSGIYTSTDYGNTWISNSTAASPSQVAISADGTRLAAAGGSIYTNAGTVWSPAFNSSSQLIGLVASSADGTRLVAASVFALPFGNPPPTPDIYTSTNSGATWAIATNSPSGQGIWHSVVSSANGKMLAASLNIGGIYTSTNAGITWVLNSLPPASYLAGSADGNTLFAVSVVGLLKSTDAGIDWGLLVNAPAMTNMACSTNGNVLFGFDTTNIYSSLNGGVTWNTNTAPLVNPPLQIINPPPSSHWAAIAVSGDGSRGVAAFSNGEGFGGISILQQQLPQFPLLSIDIANHKLSILWATNYAASRFGLEENTNLSTANWSAVTNVPTVTNTFYQIIMPPAGHQDFFRLASPP